MAFGFTPHHQEDLYLEHFTPQQFLALALESAKRSNWRIDFVSSSGFLAQTENGKFKFNARITFKIEGEQAFIKSESLGSGWWDLGRNKKIVDRFMNDFIDLKYSLQPSELDLKSEELSFQLNSVENDLLNDQSLSSSGGFLSLFMPREGYLVTPLLIIVNVMVWIVMVSTGVHWLTPDNEMLLKWGANFRPMTTDGEWWRLLSNTFIHIGVFHLLMNMYALVYIGLLLEPRIGSGKFLVTYFLAGITASVASLWWHDYIISAGASGAIFGMYGLFLALLSTKLIEKETRKDLLSSIGVFVLYNLIYGMKGGIDNAAHIGGLLGGALIGFAFLPSLKDRRNNSLNYFSIITVTVLVVSFSFIFCKSLPNDMLKYTEKMNSFVNMEQLALEVYKMPANLPKEKYLNEIKERGLYYWNENLKLLYEADSLSLPDHLHERNRKMIDYCNLRVKCYELIYKSIDEETDKYKDEIRVCNNRIQSLVDDLSGK